MDVMLVFIYNQLFTVSGRVHFDQVGAGLDNGLRGLLFLLGAKSLAFHFFFISPTGFV